MQRLRNKAQLAFTVLELMAVISILCVLAALILPAITSSKKQVLTVYCRNNHRQLALGWTQYADDNDGALMRNVDGVDKVPLTTNWVSGDMQSVSGSDATNSLLLIDTDRTQMAAYVFTPTAYKCPADQGNKVRSVSMNCRLNPMPLHRAAGFVGGLGTNFATFRTIYDIGKPSDIFVTLDEASNSINDGYFAIDMTGTGKADGVGTPDSQYWVDTPASYHNWSVVLSFSDGHVDSHRWREFTTTSSKGNGVRSTSNYDSDIQWLQAHTTYRK